METKNKETKNKETKSVNNIVVIYNKEDWNKSLSRKLVTIESILVALSTLFSIGIFIGCTLFFDNINMSSLGMALGMITMTLSLILLIALIEKYTYGKQITGFRFIDWFSIQDSIKAKYDLSTILLESRRNKEHTSTRIESLLHQFGCSYNIEFKDRYKMTESTPIYVTVNATNKDSMLVNVEVAHKN